MTKRLFIAVDIDMSDQMFYVFQKLKQKLNSDNIKWVAASNFHLTLKFLGGTEEKNIPKISSIIKEISTEQSPFEISIKGIGRFTHKTHTKVIWMGIEDYSQSLKNIATKLNEKLLKLGYEKEQRTFKAHLSLGRVKFIKNEHILSDFIQSYTNKIFHTEKIDKLVLYQSILKPYGPTYKPVFIHFLKQEKQIN